MSSATATKKEDPTDTNSGYQLQKYCKPLAFVSLFFAVALLLYVLFSPSSPKNAIMLGGKTKRRIHGGCGCDTPGYGGRR